MAARNVFDMLDLGQVFDDEGPLPPSGSALRIGRCKADASGEELPLRNVQLILASKLPHDTVDLSLKLANVFGVAVYFRMPPVRVSKHPNP